MPALCKFMIALALLYTGQEHNGTGFTQGNRHNQRFYALALVNDPTADPNKSSGQIETPPWYETPEGWLFILGVPTLFFVGSQAKASAASAKAMRESVTLSKDTAKRQLRAYLTVGIGEAIYQERRMPEKPDLMFEARPLLINTGETPAHGIRFKARAAILPVPLPREVNLPETFDDGMDSMLGPNQSANMFAVVDGFCHDQDVETIKRGDGRALYVWGLITYVDVFGDQHYTRFCQQIFWTINDGVRGLYIPGRNDADYQAPAG